MSVTFLPNTSIASSTRSKAAIFTYAQSYYGELIELQGKLSCNPEVYTKVGSPSVVTPTSDDLPPKRFTPLATVCTHDWNTQTDRRYVFYLDNNNRLCDAYFDTQWHQGSLAAQNWVAAPYSRLAAIQLTNGVGANFICVYYQNTADTGDIKQVSYSHSGWATGPPPINDPPVIGSSLCAVAPEEGIKSSVSTDGVAPVVFFQYDNLAMGSSQDLGDEDYVTYSVQQHTHAMSAHSSIAAVDDGANCYVFYTADDNSVQRMRIAADGTHKMPTAVALDMAPIPASPLSAVMFSTAPSETIVLFYLLHWAADTKSTERIRVYASTLTRSSTAEVDADNWAVSAQVRLAR